LKALVIDISKCNGCHNCQIACKDEHVGNDWTPYAKPQPIIGQFWTKVIDTTRGTVPKVKVNYMHSICQHCDEAPCIPACPQKAIYKREDGIVIIHPQKCAGSRNCIDACPYQVIYFNRDLNISQKCTFCAHLLDKGWKEPRCVDVCPTGALTSGEEDELRDLIKKAEVLHPEFKAKPRVYYIGLPKRFIAGALYDPKKDECIEGAKITITDNETDEKVIARSDDFGDFWVESLKVGTFSLLIEKDGYRTKEILSIRTEKDVNLGDIELRQGGDT
jgi:tetrathionate reductase subunit B